MPPIYLNQVDEEEAEEAEQEAEEEVADEETDTTAAEEPEEPAEVEGEAISVPDAEDIPFFVDHEADQDLSFHE